MYVLNMKTFLSNLILFILSIFFILYHDSSYASNDFWKKLAIRSDVKISIDKKTNLRTAHFSGGVIVNETKKGGTIGIDNSGHGAILCIWTIYTHMKNMSDICSPDSKNIFKKMIDNYIDKINDFIAVNSLSPITKVQLEEQIKKKFLVLKERTDKMTKKQFGKQCSSYDFVQIMKNKTSTMSPKELKTYIEKSNNSIDNSLSLIRPAVGNPCL